jgi:hypothetical protein
LRPPISYVIVVLLCLSVKGYSRILPDTVGRGNFYSQQEGDEVLARGKKYLDFNIRSLDRYNRRVSRQQEKLLNKLKRKEKVYAVKLKRKDSASFVRYQQQSLSFDSISRINKSSASIHRIRSGSNVDSLVAIQKFLDEKAPFSTKLNSNVYTDKLGTLKSDQQYNSYIGELINQRFTNLKNINANAKTISGFKSIDKQVFYAKEKIKVFKQINDEPSKVEEQALEILQGQQGFDKWMDQASGRKMPSGSLGASELEKMGYQTKRQIKEQLQQKLGSNLGGIQQSMGKQISDYQDRLKDVKAATGTLKQSKQSLRQLKNTNKPSFNINPMRAMPFSKRIEKQWNFQTNRATVDGNPAMLQLSAMAGFKHTPKLIYGAGIATSIGLGRNWNNIKFSFEGLGVRTFAEWQWLYGIGAYAGYERMFKLAAFINAYETIPQQKENTHSTSTYNESILIGLTKRYRINDRMKGSIQVLYDIWYKDKGLRTPIQLRFTNISN